MFGFNYLQNFLQEEGFRINDQDTFFTFKYQGTTFVVFKNESVFLQIVLMCNTSGNDRTKLLEVCNELNCDKFVVKFTLNDDNVWCNYEFEPNEHTTAEDFEAALAMLERGSNQMFEKLNA